MPEVTTGYVEVLLTQGQVALVDEADAVSITAHKWFAHRRRNGNFYAMRNVREPGGKHTTVYMHKVLTGYSQTDHKNGNGLDNRRANLRPATALENNCNSAARIGSSSQFKGVSWSKDSKAWAAQIRLAGKQTNLGRYSTEEEAARVYDSAAREAYGEFARLNFPDSD